MPSADSRRITSLGDSLIDFLPIQEQEQTTGFHLAPGGSMLNVAVGLARLGAPVAYAGKVANDFFGVRLWEYMRGEGIDERFVARMEGHTTLAFTAMLHGEPSFTFYGDGTADTLLAIDELPEEFFSETAILHTGSTSLLRGTIPGTIHAAMERLRGRALISLDPNIRPSLVRDRHAFHTLFDHLAALTDVLKLSTVDLAWLYPDEAEASAVRRLLDAGPEVVLVTHGHEGVFLSARSGIRLRCPTFPVKVVDTVGAGDAFSAGLLASLFEHDITSRAALAQCTEDMLALLLLRATAVAALNCTRPGANPPTHAEVDAYLREHAL